MSKVWHNSIPFKTSFITWRLFKRKLPFNDTAGRFGTNITSRCSWCNFAQVKTMEHAFMNSDAAIYIWNEIGNPLGIKHESGTIIGTFKRWWDEKNKIECIN